MMVTTSNGTKLFGMSLEGFVLSFCNQNWFFKCQQHPRCATRNPGAVLSNVNGKKNGYTVNKIIAVNCIFEAFLKDADNDVSRKNKVAAGQSHWNCHECLVLALKGVLQQKGDLSSFLKPLLSDLGLSPVIKISAMRFGFFLGKLQTLKSSQKSPEEESRVSEKQCLENDEALTFLGLGDGVVKME
ncbi:hypothetical protein HGM15179_003781 [Zosterops borbonicus]|uniref:Uncharacterized protein n=1 Tax=Zosterops borbonicus TaxID=364589 RepID=A0A8K1GTD8_9PASS|nr:hypothetical protein HGM15179_003781 [Zosterops borbonicus]